MQIVISSSDTVCPVGYVNFTKLKLVPKATSSKYTIRTSNDFIKQINDTCSTHTNDILELLTETEKDKCDVHSVNEPELMVKDNDNEVLTLMKFLESNEPKTFTNIHNKPQITLNKKGWLWIAGIQNDRCKSNDIKAAVKDVLVRLEGMLKMHDYSLRDLVNVILYIGDMEQYGVINGEYIDVINFQNPPTRICVDCVLPKDCVIIMEVVAYKSFSSLANTPRDDAKRSVLHVQGISHWAPANIGPYSQSIRVRPFQP